MAKLIILLAALAIVAGARTENVPGPGTLATTDSFPSTHHGITSAPDFAAEASAVAAAAAAWAAAVNAHDAAATAALYDPEALLYATFQTIVETPEALLAYFEHLFEKPGFAVRYNDQAVRLYADNVATASGLYTFSHRASNTSNAIVVVPSRYSFVYVLEAAGTPAAGQWRIVEHHSSVDPEAAA